MRRIRSVLGVAIVMVAALVFVQAPAMADDLDFDGIDDVEDFCDDFDLDGFCDDFFFFDGGAAPAFQTIGNEAESGDVDLSFDTFSAGNNSNQSVAPLQFGNTGSNQNAQGFVQIGSTAGDVEFEGGVFEFSPTLSSGSNQFVQQSTSAWR